MSLRKNATECVRLADYALIVVIEMKWFVSKIPASRIVFRNDSFYPMTLPRKFLKTYYSNVRTGKHGLTRSHDLFRSQGVERIHHGETTVQYSTVPLLYPLMDAMLAGGLIFLGLRYPKPTI